ncbi:hypothetical protein AB1484_25005 [Parafrankia sp. FMc6]|uniref:hypothetical protein n=1 Tax=Parafrankia soli TaxID=2599596 RepID=UPI0034D4704A
MSQHSFGVADAAAPVLVVLLALSPWPPRAVLARCTVVALAILTTVSLRGPRQILRPAETAPDAGSVLVPA